MLTEVDMIRIMAEKYRMTESIGEAYTETRIQTLPESDKLADKLYIDFTDGTEE